MTAATIPNPRPIAVITGAAGGMGRAIARRLGTHHRLLVSDLRPAAVTALHESLADEGHDVVASLGADITVPADVSALAEAVGDAGAMDVLVHAPAISMSMGSWQAILRTNLIGTALVHEALLPYAGSGTVAVFLASSMGHSFVSDAAIDEALDEPLSPDLLESLEPLLAPADVDRDSFAFKARAYGASKRGVLRLVRRNVRVWAERGARIVSVSPGTILTPMWRRDTADSPQAADMGRIVPLARLGLPAEVASAVDFLSSRDAAYITGSDIAVDGGIVAARLHGV